MNKVSLKNFVASREIKTETVKAKEKEWMSKEQMIATLGHN